MKIVKLTAQYNGYQTFTHCAKFEKFELRAFLERRNWCWEQWGPSSEEELYLKGYILNPVWSWRVDHSLGIFRLYFKDRRELSWFLLTWSEK